jgi:hypothetical protein
MALCAEGGCAALGEMLERGDIGALRVLMGGRAAA